MKDKVFDILAKMEFFQGQRAGRELWFDKPKEVQDKDIADFVNGINYIRSYLQDSVVLSREEYSKNLQTHYFMGQREIEEEYKNIQIPRERKETAEKIYSFAVDFSNGSEEWQLFLHNFREEFEIKE